MNGVRYSVRCSCEQSFHWSTDGANLEVNLYSRSKQFLLTSVSAIQVYLNI